MRLKLIILLFAFGIYYSCSPKLVKTYSSNVKSKKAIDSSIIGDVLLDASADKWLVAGFDQKGNIVANKFEGVESIIIAPEVIDDYLSLNALFKLKDSIINKMYTIDEEQRYVFGYDGVVKCWNKLEGKKVESVEPISIITGKPLKIGLLLEDSTYMIVDFYDASFDTLLVTDNTLRPPFRLVSINKDQSLDIPSKEGKKIKTLTKDNPIYRAVVKRNIRPVFKGISSRESKSFKAVCMTCLNYQGKVIHSFAIKQETDIEDKRLLENIVKASLGYEFEPISDTTIIECRKLIIKGNGYNRSIGEK